MAATSAGRHPESTTALKARGEDVDMRDSAPTPYRCRMGSLLLAHLPSPAQNDQHSDLRPGLVEEQYARRASLHYSLLG